MSLTPIVTEYAIEPFPLDFTNGHHWIIKVQRLRNGKWVVSNSGYYLTADITWWPEIATAQRYPDHTSALAAVSIVLPRLVVGTTTWDDMVAKWGMP